jgi:hypothetical protein
MAGPPTPIASPDAPPVVLVALTGPYKSVTAKWGSVGWRGGMGVAPEWDQNGKYAQAVQSQAPANIPGVQLRCGVEDLVKSYYFPNRSPLPSFQQTQQPTNLPGPQLFGSAFTGSPGGVYAGQVNNGLASLAAGNAGGVGNVILAEHLAQSGAY